MTPEAIAAKNSLTDTGAWLLLLKIYSPKQDLTLRVTNNTADVVWKGDTYQAFPFDIGEYKEGVKGEFPSLQLKVSNVTRIMQGYVENDEDFGSGWDVDLFVVYEPTPAVDGTVTTDRDAELHLTFVSSGASCDETWCVFSLGMENPLRRIFPYRRFVPNQCQAKFKVSDTGCPYAGSDDTCDYTLSDCKSKFGDSDVPFVGFPGIPTGRGVFKI
ncbi:hypothetical protein [Hydrogenimonas urashimensis]|uniref:hypothetical protein n=1 Tax=Hydrogenimonas urashimensis TaxID=2740515 RepID=UPI0019151C8E|nr:hypothetical protein [Hydrogenimonas urashimensis]